MSILDTDFDRIPDMIKYLHRRAKDLEVNDPDISKEIWITINRLGSMKDKIDRRRKEVFLKKYLNKDVIRDANETEGIFR